MEVEFTDSFFKSINKIARRNTWWHKLYELFRRNIPWFFKNVFHFRKELYNFRTWDSSYNLAIFRRSIELTRENILKYGLEVEEQRVKKLDKMQRAITLLKRFEHDEFIALAEKELGEIPIESINIFSSVITEHQKAVFKRSYEIQVESWRELWDIIHGTDSNSYYEQDGSNIQSWWD